MQTQKKNRTWERYGCVEGPLGNTIIGEVRDMIWKGMEIADGVHHYAVVIGGKNLVMVRRCSVICRSLVGAQVERGICSATG